jgi:hypothetical protein
MPTTSRTFILAAVCVLGWQPQLWAQSGYEDSGPAATTVKSSKSNTSDRMGGGGGGKGASTRAPYIKSSKSKGSERSKNLNSSRSNIY